jgi:putative ABC transport system ATP-binding protein
LFWGAVHKETYRRTIKSLNIIFSIPHFLLHKGEIPMTERTPTLNTAVPSIGIRLQAVSKEYPVAETTLKALNGIDLLIPPGEFLAVVGKSGSGKSTLLNMVSGIDHPTSGEIWVGDEPVHSLSEGRLAKWRGRSVGVVFQFFQLMPSLTIIENVLLPMDLSGILPARKRDRYALELLDRVGVADQANKLPSSLSGGQQQRAAIARALANDPKILAADEPTGNLDSSTAESVFSLFTELARDGKTVIIITHDRDIARRAGRIVTLQDGRIVSDIQPKGDVRHG